MGEHHHAGHHLAVIGLVEHRPIHPGRRELGAERVAAGVEPVLAEAMLIEDASMGGEDVAGGTAGLQLRLAGEQSVLGGRMVGPVQRARLADHDGAHDRGVVVPVGACEFERDLVVRVEPAAA